MPRKKKTPEEDAPAPKPKRTRKKPAPKEDVQALTPAESYEREVFKARTKGVELQEVREFNPTRWGVYSGGDIICGRSRAAAIENAIAHHLAKSG